MKKSLQHQLDLILVLTQKELKVRYKNSYLGYLWSIMHPLAFAFVFFIAFKVFMKVRIENYVLFLIAGLFPWQWFANSVNFSPRIFLGNTNLVKKVNFPRNILPLSSVIQDMIHFILSIPVILLFIFIYHKSPSLSWLYGIPILLVIQFMIIYGISLMVSSVNLFFKDLERLIGIFMTLLFYFTPVLYPETMIPERLRYLMYLNPVAPLMLSWKNLFLKGTLEPIYIMLSFAYSLIFFMLGYVLYKKLSWKFAEVL
ncbi:MAG: ABC transporter permease [Thermodesulfovibrionales bacterium]